MLPVIKVGNSFLRAVPAIHYKAIFAREIFRLCNSGNQKPDAIAVELGSNVVLEIIKWMKELGIGPGKKNELPCMLGILIENNLVHPKYRETASRLQQHYGKPINEIPLSTLSTLLHYSPNYLVSISSTDSIMEAIRCGIELEIPVYGIDIGGFSMCGDRSLLIQDADIQNFDLANFVYLNEKTAAHLRDEYVDGRREIVMASRLKAILLEHKNVVFTCGLAHWESIKSKLADPEVMPATIPLPASTSITKRVIIHPTLAVRSMDTYPILTTIYEENRWRAKSENLELIQLQAIASIFRKILQQSYAIYFSENEKDSKTPANVADRERIAEFERLLSAMRLVQQRRVTSMADLVDIALKMMPEKFNTILLAQLMVTGRPWASAKRFPELPILAQAYPHQSETESDEFNEQFQLFENYLHDGNQPSYLPSHKFGAKYRPLPQLSRELIRYWSWSEEPEQKIRKRNFHVWIWPPCESILFGSAYEAQKIAVSCFTSFNSAVFEGSLYNGLDTKATMRSLISGERKVYVKKPLLMKKSLSPDGKNPEPTVFIFGDINTGKVCHWSLLMGGTSLGNHIKNKDRYNEVVSKYGSYFISSVGMISRSEIPENMTPYVESISELYGFLAFGSPCINAKQGSQWVEDNDFKVCPVLNYSSFDLLLEYYRNHKAMEIVASDWKAALVQFALPFAKERVVLVAPDDYKLPMWLIALAKASNVSIDRVSLNYFSAERIAQMRKRITVSAMDSDGFAFSPDIENALGQKADDYLELLPPYMQQQLHDTKN